MHSIAIKEILGIVRFKKGLWMELRIKIFLERNRLGFSI